jgi:hypothetical protein
MESLSLETQSKKQRLILTERRHTYEKDIV